MFEEILPNIYLITNLKSEYSFSMRISLKGGGSSYEEKEERGLSHLLEHTLVARTKKYDFDDLQDYLFANEIKLNAETSHENLDLLASGHREFSQEVMEMLIEMAFEPTLTISTLEREKAIIVSEIKERKGDPDYIFSRAFNRQILEQGSEYRKSILGKTSLVENCTLEKIKTLYSKIIKRSHIIIKISGGSNFTSYNNLKKWIVNKLTPLTPFSTRHQTKINNHYLTNTFKPFKSLIYCHKYAHKEIDFYVVLPEFNVNYNNRALRLIFSELLFWNPGGYLYNRLRNELGIIYGLSGGFDHNLRCLGIDLFTNPKQINQLSEEITKVLSDPCKFISKEKFEIFKKAIRRRAEINTDKSHFIPNYLVTTLTTYGREFIDDYIEDYIGSIENAKYQDLQSFAEEVAAYYNIKRKTIIISQNEDIKKFDISTIA